MLCLVVVAFAAAFSASAANAGSGMTVSFGSPSLSPSRVAITVPVNVSCAPFDPTLLLSSFVSVSVEQASGTGIAHGFGSLGASFVPGFPLPFPCDGASHTVSVTVLADTSGRPFHGGPATVSGFAEASGWTCDFGCFVVADEQAQVGATTLNLH